MGIFDWLKGKPSTSKVGQVEASTPKPSATTEGPKAPSRPVDQVHRPLKILPSDPLLKHSKPGWLLHTAPGEGKPSSGRVGGRPYMAPSEDWPCCGECENPLSFLMQYDLETPADAARDNRRGLVRLFYCDAEDCIGMGGWDAFDPQHHLSILTDTGTLRDVPDHTKIHPAAHITRWEKIDDVPHWEDRSDDLRNDNASPYLGHKFAGWPHWIQGPERPDCPTCQTEMVPIIQLDEDHTRSFNFGSGVGHISQCSNHPDVLAFGWACG